MRKQDWAQLVSVGAVVSGVVTTVRGHRRQGAVFAGLAILADQAGRRWSRLSPSPIPATLRWELLGPRPVAALRRTLRPQPGDHILEIGPGLGQQAVQVADWVTPRGQMHVVDVQQGMLDATLERARQHGVSVIPALADESGRLPYDDASFDGAFLSSVLGEIPDPSRALSELYRVLKPKGRLIVAEVAGDPDYISPTRLRRLADAVGFTFDERHGPFFGYHARFVRPGPEAANGL